MGFYFKTVQILKSGSITINYYLRGNIISRVAGCHQHPVISPKLFSEPKITNTNCFRVPRIISVQDIWWFQVSTIKVRIKYDIICGGFYGLRYYLWQITWPKILFVADGMVKDTIWGRWHGQRYYLGQIVWPMILFVTDFVACDTICGRFYGLGY